MREVVNTLMYQARTGCQWDYLPHDLVAKSTVWDYFIAWQGEEAVGHLRILARRVASDPRSTLFI